MITAALLGLGINFVKDLVTDHGEDLVKQGIKKVTGIDLNKTEPKDLTPEQINLIKQSELEIRNLDFKKLELYYTDKADSRNHNVNIQIAKDWLVRNTGSIIGLFTVISAFVLDLVILYMVFNNIEVSPILTLIAGANNVKASQVLSFYFGDSKTNADSRRVN